MDAQTGTQKQDASGETQTDGNPRVVAGQAASCRKELAPHTQHKEQDPGQVVRGWEVFNAENSGQ